MMGTKIFITFISVLGFILVLVSPAYEATFRQTETAEDLYESAIFKKDVGGDLKRAIELFKKILAQFPNNRKVAAKAQLQIGICSEKLGLEVAKKAYQKVVEQYPDQAEAVRIAKQKLYLLGVSSSAAAEKTNELILRKVDIPDGTPSPDGKYTCYIDWDTCDLVLFEIATGEKRRLTHAPEDLSEMVLSDPVWISGSNQIVYAWVNKTGFRDLRIVNRDGTGTQVLYGEEGKHVGSIAGITEKGEIFFNLSSKDQPKVIASVSVKDKTFKVIKTVGNIYTSHLTMTPDKKYIAFDFQNSNNFKDSDIRVISIDGKQESLLVEHPANDTLIGWTPKGDYVLFISDRTGTTAIWAVAFVDGKSKKEPVLIKDNLGLIHPLGITKEGKLYYTLTKWGQDAYIAKLDLSTGKILSPPERVNRLFQGKTTNAFWSPNGKFLAYLIKTRAINSPFNFNTLRLRTLDTEEERDISLGYTARPSQSVKWSPDNKYIFLRGQNKDKKGGFFKLNTETGTSELILDYSLRKKTESNLSIYLQEWSSDGNIIYETIMNMDEKLFQRKTNIVRTNLKTGTKETIYQSKEPGLIRISLSPDEQWIALLKRSFMPPSTQTISILPVQQVGKEIELFQSADENLNIGSFFWGPSGKGLFFAKRYFVEEGGEERKSELWYIPSFDEISPRKLELEMFGIRFVNFHLDGQTIAFDSGKYPESEVWVMENFMSVINEKKK